MGKFWVEGKWHRCFAEATAYAKRTGARRIWRTDGWTPTVIAAVVA